MSAGGVIAVSYAVGQSPVVRPTVKAGAAHPQAREERAVVAPFDGYIGKRPLVEDRLEAVEKKLDELLSRSTPMGADSGNKSSSREWPAPAYACLIQTRG